jgi:DNA-binding transcriptional ArsR family regulator
MSIKQFEGMNPIEISKNLANETRMNILHWLKKPDENFPPPSICDVKDWRAGVCVQVIQEKAGISQSVCSGYLAAMQRAGLLTSYRSGKWTYYKRNQTIIQEFAAFLQKDL